MLQASMHLVFPSFDGHGKGPVLVGSIDLLVCGCCCDTVYIVNGRTGCINKIDIGERSYGESNPPNLLACCSCTERLCAFAAMVLADDILGRGTMDLVSR